MSRIGVSIGRGVRPRRRIYRGRFAELEREFYAGRRPNQGEDLPPATPEMDEPPGSVFSRRWLVLEHVGGEMPDLRAAALVGKTLRNTMMSGYRRTVGGSAIPEVVSGHAADGSPLGQAHMAIVPLAFLEAPFGDGRVLGFALVPPGDGALLDDGRFQAAIREVAMWSDKEGRRELKLVGDAVDIVLTPTLEAVRRSLDPAPYVATARTWASCTPIVLDRHLKERRNAARDRETQELVAQACRNIGLPTPASIRRENAEQDTLAIASGKHSAVRGAPPAYPSGRVPAWMGWRLPDSLASRQLTHAVLQFEQPVRGPVILGAGRFAGLGLCRALDPEDR